MRDGYNEAVLQPLGRHLQMRPVGQVQEPGIQPSQAVFLPWVRNVPTA